MSRLFDPFVLATQHGHQHSLTLEKKKKKNGAKRGRSKITLCDPG
jgi:hypothetical protein